MKGYVYLDNAATSFPKPRSVKREVNTCIADYCGNPGRGSHFFAMESAKKIYPQWLTKGDILLIINDLPEEY